ncbi:hypothetical protein ERAG_04292, partial [Escherichia coli R424]
SPYDVVKCNVTWPCITQILNPPGSHWNGVPDIFCRYTFRSENI